MLVQSKRFILPTIFIFVFLPSLPELIEARNCYSCMTTTPLFDPMDDDTHHEKYPPCSYHKNVTCDSSTSRSKCFIKLTQHANKSLEILKGCEADSSAVGCTATNPGGNILQVQKCVCAKRFCNADLVQLGGKYVEGMYAKATVKRLSKLTVSSSVTFVLTRHLSFARRL